MKKILSIASVLLICASLIMPLSAEDDYNQYIDTESAENTEDLSNLPDILQEPNERLLPRFVDNADLLSDEDEAKLTETLDEISERQDFDVVVLTVPALDDGYTEIMDFADDYYDYNGFGIGENRDGAVLVLDMGERDWWISTRGYGITAFTDYGIEYVGKQMVPYLSDGDYLGGFEKFAEYADYYINCAKSGEPFDISGNNSDYSDVEYDKGEYFKTVALKYSVISIIIGALLGFIPVSIMKGKLKSVSRRNDANMYMKKDSLNLTSQKDVFLYQNLSKTARPKETESSGGSSTHTSSSGATHGGGGGKF